MPKAVFEDTEPSDLDLPKKVQKNILSELREMLDNLRFKTFIGLNNYHVEKKEWPTYKELAQFMGEKPANIQPRLHELRKDRMVTELAGTRPCSESDHNRSVSTHKIRNEILGSIR